MRVHQYHLLAPHPRGDHLQQLRPTVIQPISWWMLTWLRYKKCGIICADVKCRYIPTRSELRELRSQGIRDGGQCYVCKGDVIFRNWQLLFGTLPDSPTYSVDPLFHSLPFHTFSCPAWNPNSSLFLPSASSLLLYFLLASVFCVSISGIALVNDLLLGGYRALQVFFELVWSYLAENSWDKLDSIIVIKKCVEIIHIFWIWILFFYETTRHLRWRIYEILNKHITNVHFLLT